MYDIQLMSSLIVIGILLYSALIHGLVYWRLGHKKEHSAFAVLCVWFAAYAATNIIDLYLVTDLDTYILISKISTVFVIFTIATLAWFAAEYLHDKKHIPLKVIAFLLAPFLALNLFMPNGILWSGIEGIAPVTRAFGATVMHPVNAVISIPMYGLWTVIAVIYLLMAYAAYLSFRKSQSKRGALFLGGIVLLSAGFVFDMLIDFGINRSYVYISEFIVLIYVVLMSLYLSDELRIYELNLEALVKQRTDALEQTNKELESFSYSVSHDLRAPLRAIHGFTNALDEDYGHLLDAGAKQFMQKISNNAKRMEAMINGLLQISRVNRGELNKIEVNISELAAQIVEQLKQQNPNRSVTVDIENNLHTHGDPSLLRVVLQNLLDNAWKFTQHVEDAKISIKKHVTVDGEKGFVVQDNGAGFNPDYKEKLFIPFQRLHSEEQYAGNGIGLATVARIVRRHGGKIWAEGQENQGASFYVILN